MVFKALWVASFPRCTAASNIVGISYICLHVALVLCQWFLLLTILETLSSNGIVLKTSRET